MGTTLSDAKVTLVMRGTVVEVPLAAQGSVVKMLFGTWAMSRRFLAVQGDVVKAPFAAQWVVVKVPFGT